jgi:diguanylate cyclase (GGDEF)-like protein
VARFGGDEFLVLAALRDEAGAHALALHMLEAVRSVTAQPVSASIGYALAPSDAQAPLKLLQMADEAMYEAKRQGKNRVVHGGGASLAPQTASSG